MTVDAVSDLKPALQHIGKSVSVLLPLQIEGVTNEYLFTFKVYDVEIPEPTTTAE